MRGKLSSRFVRGLALLIVGGACALGVVAMPALAGTSSSTPTSTAPGVTTAAPRTPAATGVTAHLKPRRRPPSGEPAFCTRAASTPLQDVPRLRQAGARLAAARRSAQSEHGEERSAAGRLASLVDTRTWTSGGGNTFPGADVPFGMVQWSPDTMPTYNAGGGYDYSDTKLWGYSLTHVSGPGCGAAGDVPMVPTTGSLPTGDPNTITTAFSQARRWRRPATTQRRATSRIPSPQSSPRRRTARWRASPTRPRIRPIS